MVHLADDERLDFLPLNHLKIIQSQTVFSFSMDAVLLAQFAYLPLKKGKVMDLCTGNGAVALMLSTRTQAAIEGIEIQERLYDMAVRSVRLNHKEKQITIHHQDLREAQARFELGSYDVVTCNPPYLPAHTGQTNVNEHYAIARHELYCTLEDILSVSAALLKPKGRLALVHRPSRLADILTLLRRYRLEPKRMCLVHPKADKPANMVLVEGMKDGQPDLRLLPPLIAYTADNEYTPQMKRIYFGEETLL
ncbi:tRNA1(Val) A37 N6-methylase TrmN6 [Caldalkalibacillus uzonensis]|uniref:tRNA1(Val) A37 N6-methylase TrmN6 n=1 Tax=Caldalkalibacillus uzonensis TaxID=353224 RepID=A0ABU0CXP8_9BACI|nr:tRNA1(Val) (adenine(37)-N6)-methyltransferase [Caldalkalibacillus uzonensis]MDQ0340622.1 tRNA1(Val) A37 N6-methylase TrmN6 [Caldalkalibacillus uzonensis]